MKVWGHLNPFCIWLVVGGRKYGFMRDCGRPPLFSERYGYTKVTRFLGFKFVRE